MPIYEYECQTCGTVFEKRQSFSEEPKAACPSCESNKTRRLIAAPAIVFKGSGFYVNDSKAKNSANGARASKGEKSESKSEKKTESSKEKS